MLYIVIDETTGQPMRHGPDKAIAAFPYATQSAAVVADQAMHGNDAVSVVQFRNQDIVDLTSLLAQQLNPMERL